MTPDQMKQYEAVRSAVGLIDCSWRGKVRLEGPDRVSFLHAMITNDVERLPVFCGRYAAFLTPRGKMVGTFYFYKLPDSILVDLDTKQAGLLKAALERFVVMDEVSPEDVSSAWVHWSLQGPNSKKALEKVVRVELPEENLQVAELEFQGAKGWGIRKNELASLGVEVLLPEGQGGLFRDAVMELKDSLGVSLVGPQVHDVLRLERGIARFGTDMDESNYPLEARLDRAISLTKGCYVGQEVVAKATHVGGVPRHLMQLQLQGETIPESGASIFDSEGRSLGMVTSAAFSPRLQCPIALGYIKRQFAEPGRIVQIELPGPARAQAQVVESFD